MHWRARQVVSLLVSSLTRAPVCCSSQDLVRQVIGWSKEGNSQLRSKLITRNFRFTMPSFASKIEVQHTPPQCQQQQQQQEVKSRNLACPICLEALTRHGPEGFNRTAIMKSVFRCQTCNKSYPSNGTYIDLTLSANHSTWQETLPFGVRLFRTKWMSLEYEERWRKSFERFGFPGPDGEVKLAEKFLGSTSSSSAQDGGGADNNNVLLDISCGTGLHSRRFAKSPAFSAVIAADFSETMLNQCHVLLKEDMSPCNEKIVLVRADASRLPFPTGSISAVYSGAALHCWVSPSAGIAEICRVLRPGGVLVATTFLPRWKSKLQTSQRVMRQVAEKIFGTKIFFFEQELDELFHTSGLVNYHKIKIDSYIMVCAQKKSTSQEP